MGAGNGRAADPAVAAEVRSWCEAGARHTDQLEFQEALQAYSRAVDLDAGDLAACLGKVTMLQLLKRPRGALQACALALKQKPECSPLQAARRELLAELGAAEAQVVLDEASGLRPPREPEDEGCTAGAGGDSGVSGAPVAVVKDDAPCPAAKSGEQVEQEGASLRSRLVRSCALEDELQDMASQGSVAFRAARKEELTGFYRDFYASTKAAIAAAGGSKLDVSQYPKAAESGLSIQDGHRPMPRPERVELPEDHGQPVGALTPEGLAKFSCESKRRLLSLHGDLFDVSDRPDKYGTTGPYHSMAGHDITWALWSGLDNEEEWDKYFDVMRCEDREVRDRRFQGLMSWWAFFESEYGRPVGRLDVYDKEWELPPPPPVEELCVIM